MDDSTDNNDYEELVSKLVGRGQRTGIVMTESLIDLINCIGDGADMHPYDLARVGGPDLFNVLVNSEVEPCDEGLLHVLIGYSILHRDVDARQHKDLINWTETAVSLLEECRRLTGGWQPSETQPLAGGPMVHHDLDMCIQRLRLFGDALDATDIIMMTWPHLHDLFNLSDPTPSSFTAKPAMPGEPHGISRELMRGYTMVVASCLL